jgi:hypothetical protein
VLSVLCCVAAYSLKQAALKAGGQAGATLQQLKAKVRAGGLFLPVLVTTAADAFPGSVRGWQHNSHPSIAAAQQPLLTAVARQQTAISGMCPVAAGAHQLLQVTWPPLPHAPGVCQYAWGVYAAASMQNTPSAAAPTCPLGASDLPLRNTVLGPCPVVAQAEIPSLVPLLSQALERAQAGKASAATHGLHTE